MTERIAAAAIRVNDEVWTLPPPTRHNVLVRAWCDAHYRDGARGQIPDHDQGFVTDCGNFVDRKVAWEIAKAAGQLLPRAPTGHEGTLYSEDVW